MLKLEFRLIYNFYMIYNHHKRIFKALRFSHVSDYFKSFDFLTNNNIKISKFQKYNK